MRVEKVGDVAIADDGGLVGRKCHKEGQPNGDEMIVRHVYEDGLLLVEYPLSGSLDIVGARQVIMVPR